MSSRSLNISDDYTLIYERLGGSIRESEERAHIVNLLLLHLCFSAILIMDEKVSAPLHLSLYSLGRGSKRGKWEDV